MRPGRYLVHPAVLDACLQALGAAWPDDEEDTYLVVGADRAWLSPCPGRVWSHAVLAPATITSTTRAADVRLMDEHGRLVGEVLGVRLRRARREALGLAGGGAPAEWLYEVMWEPSPLPDEPACARASSPSPVALAAQVEPAFRALAAAPAVATYDAVVPALEALASRYIVAALGELGWTPVVGERVAVDTLAKRLGVVTRHRRLLGRLLAILAEDGFLRVAGGGWEVIETPPVLDPESLHAELLQQYGIAAAELGLTRDCGRALADVLCGVRDPLPLLFSDDVLARTESIYADGPVARVVQPARRRRGDPGAGGAGAGPSRAHPRDRRRHRRHHRCRAAGARRTLCGVHRHRRIAALHRPRGRHVRRVRVRALPDPGHRARARGAGFQRRALRHRGGGQRGTRDPEPRADAGSCA